MKTKNLSYELHCFGRPSGDSHVAICLELSLIAKGETPNEARNKLIEQIQSYVDCLDDKNFADLFPRKSPMRYYLDYFRVRLIIAFENVRHSVRNQYQYFIEILRPGKFKIFSPI